MIEVRIEIRGGIIQNVEGPSGVILKVDDYDLSGSEPLENLMRNDFGELYNPLEYRLDGNENNTQ